MSQDILPAGRHSCYCCIQWDGKRSYDRERSQFKVDPGSPGTCRLTRQPVKGSSACQEFFALR